MDTGVKFYMCVLCGFVYDETEGCVECGIEPGTDWQGLADNWQCPECGARKEYFDLVAIQGDNSIIDKNAKNV